MKEIKHDSSTLAWNAMGDERFEMARTNESGNCFIMPHMLQFMSDVKGKKNLALTGIMTPESVGRELASIGRSLP